MSCKQTRLQVLPKFFELTAGFCRWSSSKFQTVRPADRKCMRPKGATANLQNWQLMTCGRLEMLATRNFGDWHTLVGEVPWSSVPKTTMDCHSRLVLHSLRINQPVHVVMHHRWQTTLIHFRDPVACEQMSGSILNMLHLSKTFYGTEEK